MIVSQNGLSANDRSVIRSATVPGTDVKVAVRTGPVGDLLLHVAARWHREVEPLRAPDGVLDCWGYAERTIRGSSTVLSNHASGSALDFRARAHPLGAVGTYTPAQVTAIHRIVADCRGAIRWGGDYTGRRDEMHVEIDSTEMHCAAVLAALTAPPAPLLEEDDVPLTPDEITAIARAAAAETWAYAVRNGWGDVVRADQILVGAEIRTASVQAQMQELLERVARLQTAGVDPAAIAAAVTTQLHTGFVVTSTIAPA